MLINNSSRGKKKGEIMTIRRWSLFSWTVERQKGSKLESPFFTLWRQSLTWKKREKSNLGVAVINHNEEQKINDQEKRQDDRQDIRMS